MVIEKEIFDLTKSPIYNLSMCSLENFHTCFLKMVRTELSTRIFKTSVE